MTTQIINMLIVNYLIFRRFLVYFSSYSFEHQDFFSLYDAFFIVIVTIYLWSSTLYNFNIMVLTKEAFTFKLKLNKKNIDSNQNVNSPSSEDDNWKKKIKKFWDKHKVVILTSLTILTLIGGYCTFKYYNNQQSLDGSDNDSDTDQPPIETSEQRSRRLFIERHQMLDAKRRSFEPAAQRLMNLLEEPGYEEFGVYLKAIARICELYPYDSYIKRHLLQVVNPSVDNSASRPIFIRLAHCIEDPDYGGQESSTRYWAKLGLSNPNVAARYKMGLITHVLLGYVNENADQLVEISYEDMARLTAEALRTLKENPLTSSALAELAKLLRSLAPLTKHWN